MKLTAKRLPRGRTDDHDLEQASFPEDEAYWHTYLGEYLNETEAQQFLSIDNPQVLRELVAARKILAVPTAHGMVFPKFQFVGGEVNPIISRVIKIFDSVVTTPYTTASWLRGARIDDKSVVEWIESGKDPEVVIQAAEDSASRLAA